MVDPERVIRILDRVTADVRKLSASRAGVDSTADDEMVLNSVKYLFITAIEGCVRVAQHVIASEGWPVADTNAEAVRRLATEGVLSRQTAEAVARAVGFRNVLVHLYAAVDDKQVLANLDRVGDLTSFVGEVAAWVDRT